jgi:hypothetical protein
MSREIEREANLSDKGFPPAPTFPKEEETTTNKRTSQEAIVHVRQNDDGSWAEPHWVKRHLLEAVRRSSALKIKRAYAGFFSIPQILALQSLIDVCFVSQLRLSGLKHGSLKNSRRYRRLFLLPFMVRYNNIYEQWGTP